MLDLYADIPYILLVLIFCAALVKVDTEGWKKIE